MDWIFNNLNAIPFQSFSLLLYHHTKFPSLTQQQQKKCFVFSWNKNLIHISVSLFCIRLFFFLFLFCPFFSLFNHKIHSLALYHFILIFHLLTLTPNNKKKTKYFLENLNFHLIQLNAFIALEVLMNFFFACVCVCCVHLVAILWVGFFDYIHSYATGWNKTTSAIIFFFPLVNS